MCSVQSLTSIISFLHFLPLHLIHTVVNTIFNCAFFQRFSRQIQVNKNTKAKIAKKRNDNLMSSKKEDKEKTGTHQKKLQIKLNDKL